MTIDENPCEHADLVRDYAFDELTGADRKEMEQHFGVCADCSSELDRLRLTTAALRVLPDVEVPRRIAFVPDAPVKTGFLAGFWNSAARLGFASACVLAIGLSAASLRRPAETRTVIQPVEISKTTLDDAVSKAVALAVDRVRAEDQQLTRVALADIDRKYQQRMVEMTTGIEYYRQKNQMLARASLVSGREVSQ